MVTPAFLIIPLLRFLGAAPTSPRQERIEAVTMAAAGLVVHATIPLARDAVTGWLAAAIAAAVSSSWS